MKKLSLFIMFLSLFSSRASLWALTSPAPSLNPLKISIALPTESLEMDDLDVRDEMNRPVKSFSSKVEFVRLWSQSLNQLVLFALTPARLKMAALLNSLWDGFAGALRTTTKNIWRSVNIWIQAKKSQLFRLLISTSSEIAIVAKNFESYATGNSFTFLIAFVISSTRLLR